jgi:hypothetical protein
MKLAERHLHEADQTRYSLSSGRVEGAPAR